MSKTRSVTSASPEKMRSATTGNPEKGKSKKPQKNGESRKRGPRHCQVCPGLPLRTECEHTLRGKKFLRNQAIALEIQGDLYSGGRRDTVNGVPTGSVLQELEIQPAEAGWLTAVRRTGMDLRLQSEDGEQQSRHGESLTIATQRAEGEPTSRVGPHFDDGDYLLSHRSNDDDFFANDTREVPLSFTGSVHFEDSEFAAEFSSYSPPPSPSAEMRERTYHGGKTKNVATHRHNSSPYRSVEALSSSPASSQYARATRSNPIHGFVKGVMRGGTDHSAVRKHALPKPVEQVNAASKRFLQMMNALFAKCEDVSTATSCWLFIGAQHVAAKAPTLHYTSPRLLAEAPEFAEEQVNSFNKQMSTLLRARRSDAVTVTAELLAAEEKNTRLERELMEVRERLRDADEIETRYNRILADMQS